MNKKILLAIIAIVILSFAAVGLLKNRQTTSIPTVKIGYLPVVQGLPLYLALEKGYFKEAGLNVQVTKMDAPNQLIDALMQEQLDFGPPSIAMGITGVADYKNPDKLKIYAVGGGTKDFPNENLLVPIDSTLTKISDLKGKKLGILAGTIQWRSIAKYILEKNNLQADTDVTLVELSPSIQIQALASKQIDALLALEPTATIAEDQGVGKILFQAPAEQFISDPFYPGAGVVNTKFASQYPQVTKQIISIMERAIKEINADQNSARKYLKNYTPLTDETIAKVPISIFKTVTDLTDADKENIQKFLDIFTHYQVVDGKIDFNHLLLSTDK